MFQSPLPHKVMDMFRYENSVVVYRNVSVWFGFSTKIVLVVLGFKKVMNLFKVVGGKT